MTRNRNKQFKSLGYERKTNGGKPNPKYVDVLQVDNPIAGQSYMCVSFISPENILKQKNIYFFEQFLKVWDFRKSMEKFSQFTNYISYKYNIPFEDLNKDFTEFVESEMETLKQSSMDDDYKTFLDHHEEELQKKFDVEHEFQTSIRGFKFRGAFPTEEEARLRAKLIRENDPSHSVFVGPVGYWVPWDPEPSKTGDVEYMEEELNQLMHEKIKNEANAKMAFEQRLRETKEKAIQENIQRAEKSGNPLTQTIDENGNLVGIATTNTQEFSLGEREAISTADICAELFEGDNIVVGKTDNGQSLLKSGPFAKKG